MSKFEDDVDPAFLRAQIQRIKEEQRKHRNAVNPILHNQPKKSGAGLDAGCSWWLRSLGASLRVDLDNP